MSKEINARVLLKYDTAENWAQATFIPRRGEMIIYAPDEAKNIPVRYKIGDGETPIYDLPFVTSTDADTLDGKHADEFTTVHIGSTQPTDGSDFWIDPNGAPTSVEDWSFELEDGTNDTKTVVVMDSDDAAEGDKAAILRVKQADGSYVEIPALVGSKGAKGDPGYTPQKNVDYFDGQNGTSCTHSWNGTILTVTSASGTSSADLKGGKGDPGVVDYSRLNDYLPKSGGTITGTLGVNGLLTQGSPSSDATITSMNRFTADLFVEGNGSAPNTPKAAGFYLGKSASDGNRHMDIVSGDTYSYIDFNKASNVLDYDVRLLVDVDTGYTQFMWDNSKRSKALNILGSVQQNGEQLATVNWVNSAIASAAPAPHNQSADTITAGTFAGQVVANASSQSPSTSLVRNSKLVSSETNPTVNGEICWTYA